MKDHKKIEDRVLKTQEPGLRASESVFKRHLSMKDHKKIGGYESQRLMNPGD
jgi:hypothetical protein